MQNSIFFNISYINVYFLNTIIKIARNIDFGVYEQFKGKDEEHKIDKILLFSYSTLLILYPLLELFLNSIPVYIFKYAPLDL